MHKSTTNSLQVLHPPALALRNTPRVNSSVMSHRTESGEARSGQALNGGSIGLRMAF
jgi:hypothetical protein